MTSSEPSNETTPHRLRIAPRDGGDCPSCGGPLVSQPAAPQPVLLQVLFGASFIVFMFIDQKFVARTHLLWAWTALQAGLGVALVRARVRSKRRVFRCIRCDAAIR